MNIAHRMLDLPGRRSGLQLGPRPLLMGIVNITPDSFSDGGLFLDTTRAIEHGLRLAEEGADLLDLGAESTRPGGGVYGEGLTELDPEEELERLLPALDGLRSRLPDMPISVDTRKGAVARIALEHGADLINDVGGLRDRELRRAVAAAGCPVVAMHSRGNLRDMQRDIDFRDVVAEVRREMAEMIELATASGIDRSRVVLDPGIGFGKTARQNLELIRHLDAFAELDCPLLLGASRKSFIAGVRAAPPNERIGGSLAALAWALHHGTAIVRVHDIAASRQFVDVWNAIDSTYHAAPEPV